MVISTTSAVTTPELGLPVDGGLLSLSARDSVPAVSDSCHGFLLSMRGSLPRANALSIVGQVHARRVPAPQRNAWFLMPAQAALTPYNRNQAASLHVSFSTSTHSGSHGDPCAPTRLTHRE